MFVNLGNLTTHSPHGASSGHSGQLAGNPYAEYTAAIQRKFEQLSSGGTPYTGLTVRRVKAPQQDSDEDADEELRKQLRNRVEDSKRRELTAKNSAKAKAEELEFRREQLARLKSRVKEPKLKPAQPLDEYSAAIHEAGHIVALIIEGCEILFASVVPDGETQAFVRWNRRGDEGAMVDLRVGISGPCAQAHWEGKEWKPGNINGDYGDLLKIAQDAGEVDDETFAIACREMHATLTRHWRLVTTLAGLLVEKQTIDGGELRTLAHQHLKGTRC